MKRIGLLIIIISILTMTGCKESQVEKIDETTKSVSLDPSQGSENLDKEDSLIPGPDLNTMEGIKDYLIGEWVFDKDYVSDIVCEMNIDKDLNIELSFNNTYRDEFLGDYEGKITFDRQYARPDEAPDLISIELMEEDYPGGDFFFLHRTIYDGKYLMSLFFAGNGNCIFDMLGPEGYEYPPGEIMFEKKTKEISKLSPRKDDEFYAVFWGNPDKKQDLWLDDVVWTPTEEYDPDPLYPPRMTYYDNNVKESIVYSIRPDRMDDILGDDLFPGEVYFVKTDENGDVMEFVTAEYKEYINMVDDPDNYGYGLFDNTDLGTSEIVKSKKKVELIEDSASCLVKINDIEVLDFHLFDEARENFNHRDKLTIVTISLEVENDYSEGCYIYPTLGRMIINNKEEVGVDLMLSDNVGGESMDKGTIVFILDTEAQDIENIKYIIDAAKDEDWNSVGEEIEFEIEF